MICACLPGRPVRAENEGLNQTWPDLVISAVNAGFTGHDGSGQNFDFVELYNTTGEPIPLDGYELAYTNSSGSTTKYSFLDGTILNAEFLRLGYSGSPQFSADSAADYRYRFNIAATTGTISLLLNGEEADAMCWGNASCVEKYASFSTKADDNKTLARCIVDGLIEACAEGEHFEQVKYFPEFIFSILIFDEIDEAPIESHSSCSGLVFSEIYSYFENDYAEQFIEIHNPTDEIIAVTNCQIVYKNKKFEMSGEVEPGEYFEYRNADLRLSKNPSSSNEIGLIDVGGEEVSSMTYYNGQKKKTSYALFGIDSLGVEIWMQTYALTPGEENIYQEFRSCAVGKIINPSTGNCINFLEEEALPDCPVGKFRNPETNRCKSYENITSILAACKDGYYRNPDTNRCRKIDAATTGLTPCAEGFERNPETNRCRKVKVNNGADYGVEPTAHINESSFIAYGALAIVIVGGIAYIGFQFRHEIKKIIKKLLPRRVKIRL